MSCFQKKNLNVVINSLRKKKLTKKERKSIFKKINYQKSQLHKRTEETSRPQRLVMDEIEEEFFCKVLALSKTTYVILT